MGIRGLESYIEKECPQAYRPVNIITCASAYKLNTKRTPILLIDGNSCSRNIYNSVRSDALHLGEYEKFETQILHMAGLFKKNDIRAIFFFDGSPPEKREEYWIERRKIRIQGISTATTELGQGNFEKAKEIMQQQVDDIYFMKFVLRQTDYEVIQTVKQADDEIMEYIANHKGCFGVLAQDTDFIAIEGVENYFSAKDLQIATLNTKVLQRATFAKSIGMSERHLPLFATLCGNDVVSDQDLRLFHLKILSTHPNFHRLTKVHHLPKKLIVPRVATWIRNNSGNFIDQSSTPKVAAQLIGAPHLSEKFCESLASYLPPAACGPNVSTATSLDGNWSKILVLAEERHRRQCMASSIWTVMTRLKSYDSTHFELYDSRSFPPGGVLLRKLRQKFYGILLKERPGNLYQLAITEYIASGPSGSFGPSRVDVKFPPDHPGLLLLWGNELLDGEKMKLLCWAVSENLLVSKLLKVPLYLRMACLSLFYIVHEVESGLHKWQIEAIAVHIVRLVQSSTDQVQRMLCGTSDVIEVHIGSIFVRTWFNILDVNDACGNPLFSEKMKSLFFDGKIFNYVYKSMSKGVKGSSLCDETTLKLVLDFLYN